MLGEAAPAQPVRATQAGAVRTEGFSSPAEARAEEPSIPLSMAEDPHPWSDTNGVDAKGGGVGVHSETWSGELLFKFS